MVLSELKPLIEQISKFLEPQSNLLKLAVSTLSLIPIFWKIYHRKKQKSKEDRKKFIDDMLSSQREKSPAIMAALKEAEEVAIFEIITNGIIAKASTRESLVELYNNSPSGWPIIKNAYPNLEKDPKGKLIQALSLYNKIFACTFAVCGIFMLGIGFSSFFFIENKSDIITNRLAILGMQLCFLLLMSLPGVYWISLSLPIFRAWQLQKYLPNK